MIFKKNAFTLIEILVVVSIMAVIGIILTEVFIRSLRGGNKAEVLGLIKQNGQSVLENMDKNIRSSDDIICTDITGDVLVIEKDGIYTRYRFISGQLTEDHPVIPALVSQPQFLIDICSNLNYDNKEPLMLTDPERVTVLAPVLGNSKIFSSRKISGYKAIVTVNFLLKPGLGIPQNVADQIDSISFVTTIQVR